MQQAGGLAFEAATSKPANIDNLVPASYHTPTLHQRATQTMEAAAVFTANHFFTPPQLHVSAAGHLSQYRIMPRVVGQV